MNVVFLINSILLGVGLSMDAFSVSVANGLNEPDMKRPRMCAMAGVFAFFQALMPMIGWICVHTVVQIFSGFEKAVPWIALILLSFIGGRMIMEGIRSAKEETVKEIGRGTLLIQGIATSIDALSVGFAIADYDTITALSCALIIAAVTFAICMAGLAAGNRFASKLSGRSSLIGGIILIFIGLEIFFGGIF